LGRFLFANLNIRF